MAALTDFHSLIAPDVPGAPGVVISQAVLRTAIDFCDRAGIQIDDITVPVVAAARSAVVDLPEGYALASVLKLRGADGRKLTSTDRATAINGKRYELTEPPLEYWVGGAKTLRFECVPSANETLTGLATLKPAATATAVPDVLLDDWADAIASGAKARLMQTPGKPWSSPELAAFHIGLYEKAISDARVAVQIAKGDANLAVRPRAFGS